MKLAAIALCVLVLAAACSQGRDEDDETASVVAAFYPIADAVERIAGEQVDVTDITPAGAEPHDIELTSDALDSVNDADLVVYLGGFQPALDDALDGVSGRKLDLLAGVSGGDPHVWLDPVVWSEAIERIGDALGEVAPDADRIGDAVAASAAALEELDRTFRDGLASCERDLVVTSHDAFGRLASRYDLRVESITGVSPEAEPDPRRLAEIADLVREEGVTAIFTEELVSPEVAETIADETGARVDVLDPIESEPAGGYERAMRRNRAALTRALGCR